MLISHIRRNQDIIVKNVYHTINVTSTKAKLFAIRYSINCVTQIQDVKHIIIITDAIHAIKHIFDISIHPYQLYSITISKDLRDFFNKNSNSSILFQNCFSSNKQSFHLLVDKELKCLKMNFVLPSKLSWEFSRKEECNSIICKQQIYFQVLEYKRRKFLNLNNDNNQPIYFTYSNDSTWMKYIELSNLLHARVTRMITNHTPIEEYRLRFSSKESFTCLYRDYSIEMRAHILHGYA